MFLLLGDAEESRSKDIDTLMDEEKVIVVVFSFSAPFETADGGTACSNCSEQAANPEETLSVGRVPITNRLVRDYERNRINLGQYAEEPFRHKVIEPYISEGEVTLACGRGNYDLPYMYKFPRVSTDSLEHRSVPLKWT